MSPIKVRGYANRIRIRRDIPKDMVVLPVVLVIRIGELSNVLAWRPRIDHDQSVRVGRRRSKQKERVRDAQRDHAENHRDRQRKNGDRCQFPVLTEDPNRSNDVDHVDLI